jgi:hypothetical protein
MMRILSLEEGRKWLVDQKWRGPSSNSLPHDLPEMAHYNLPHDTGKKTVLSISLAELLTDDRQGALWIRGWSAFPSQQNLDLFYGYRKSLGENRPLIDAPFHVCSRSDVTTIQSLLCLALYFYWDVLLFKGDHELVLRLSNDEFFDVYTRNTVKRDEIIKNLSPLGVAAEKESRASLMRRSVLADELEPIEDTFLEQLRRASSKLSELPAVRKCLATATHCVFVLPKKSRGRTVTKLSFRNFDNWVQNS